MTLKSVYLYDEAGYYAGEGVAQWMPKLQRYNLPLSSTDVAPAFDAGYWYKWDGSAWQAEKKPTTVDECVALGAVSHYSQTKRDREARELIQRFADEARETHRVDRGEDGVGVWQLVEIPPKTEAVLKLEAAEKARSEAMSYLSQTDYVAAKIAEGAATKEEYAEVLAKRQEARDTINAQDVVIAALKEGE